jgi:hypothetical protein
MAGGYPEAGADGETSGRQTDRDQAFHTLGRTVLTAVEVGRHCRAP